MPSKSPEAEATDADEPSPYLKDYERHLSELRAHLHGDTGSALSSSFVPPAGYWTSREKDAFFHALAVHSRLRPDLIADAIKSKNVLAVCAYIDALERAAAAQPRDASTSRSSLEPAMEVSDSWVQYEEEQAGQMNRLELEWEAAAEEQRRVSLLAERYQDETTYWAWKEEQESVWEKQDTLSKLGRHHLVALGRVIGQAGDAYRELEPAACPPEHDMGAAESSPSRSPSPEISLSHLSPASRRRVANRIYMRKKRAEAAGIKPILTTAKLATGPKTTRVYVSKPRPKKYKPRKPKEPPLADVDQEVPDPPADSDVEMLDDVPTERASSPGRVAEGEGDEQLGTPDRTDEELDEENVYTLGSMGGTKEQYKILSTMGAQGIDAKMLIEEGYGMFNLANLSRLMRSQRLDSEDEDPPETFVSSDTIKLLRSILLDFVSNVAHRAISLREQEVILKRNYKAWRLTREEEITPQNVVDAVRFTGLNLVSTEPPDNPADDEQRFVEDEQRFVEDEPTFFARLPLHREIAPLFVKVPGGFDEKKNHLMPDETDMDELSADVDEELELDETDGQLAAQYEADLWREHR
ncbi:hypothetical protein FB45DRAFT_998481 [Roridomyces roridus]|uniref:Uncharacterized protein n=1 Tax=Roridomyces roridus TaxID=1738132 RepID=A0AAD7G0H1_9AGAR|nr:hypothetical protein FB45DRAFT_998481 [Roridomyces roridus]